MDDMDRVLEILSAKGGTAAQKAKEVIVEGIRLEELRAPMKFLADHWSDPTRPALMALSCEAVGGDPTRTVSTATAMTLMCASMDVYDDIMDRSKLKRLAPSLPGRFGDGYALIAGGLVTSKAFLVLNEGLKREVPPSEHGTILDLFKDLVYRMAEAEAKNLRLRSSGNYDPKEKFQVFEKRSVDIETCMKLGAIIGSGEPDEIDCLGSYGSCLGTVIELQEDCITSLNLMINLDDKIRAGALPYPLLWTLNQDERIKQFLFSLVHKKKISATIIRKVIEMTVETGALDHVREISQKITKEAIQNLSGIKKSEAEANLKFLAEAQHEIFVRSLDAL